LHEATYQGQILEWEQEYAESQNKGRSYILNPFKHLSWDLRSRKDKGKEEAHSPSRDDFEEQVLFGYEGSTQESLSTRQRKFNFQDEIHRRETLGSNNPLIKELPEVIDVDQLREQLYRNQEDQAQSETEYQFRSEGGPTLPNEPQNNQLPLNINFNQIDNNVAAVLAAALTGLQNVVAAPREGRVAQLPTFSGQADEDIREFIRRLEIAFQVNQVADNRRFHIAISCLIGMAANWYELNRATLANWDIAG